MDEKVDRPNHSSDAGKDMSCEDFQDRMPELMGGDIYSHEHLKTCTRCSAILEDLQAIADAARAFMQDRDYEPSDALWTKIESKMGADDLGTDSHPPLSEPAS